MPTKPAAQPGESAGISVIKLGGSVLAGPLAYGRAARFIADRLAACPGRRFVVVVSAEQGTTDALLQLATKVTARPEPRALDLLWSTGELRSVALLALALHALGVRAAAVNVHQTGLTEHERHGSTDVTLRALRLRSLLATSDVVVVPGFLARGPADTIVSLGRGGSDLTAVLLAAGLGADECELVKDVPGYFSVDPHCDATAQHLPAIDYERALEMAERDCDLVQRQALEAARRSDVTIVVRAMESEQRTVVRAAS